MPALGIDRCFALLDVLANYPQGQSLGEIAADAGIPKSGTHRMLNMLVDAGYVTQLPSKMYRLTLKLPALGFRFLSNTGVLAQCQNVLDQLAAQAGELVRLSIIDGEHLVWIAKAQGARSSLVIDPVLGRPVVLHATASGKIWLASLTTEQALRHVLRAGFGSPQEHGPRVIQSVEALQKELASTRKRGYGLAIEEAEPGVNAIAVGVAGGSSYGQIAATISVAGPTSRLSKEKLQSFLPELQDAARQLTGVDALMAMMPEPAPA